MHGTAPMAAFRSDTVRDMTMAAVLKKRNIKVSTSSMGPAVSMIRSYRGGIWVCLDDLASGDGIGIGELVQLNQRRLTCGTVG